MFMESCVCLAASMMLHVANLTCRASERMRHTAAALHLDSDDLCVRKMASDEVLSSLGVEGATAVAHALSLPADAYGNDPRLEAMWAMKAYNHAEVYFNLISSVDPKFLKLTKLDERIYSSFRETFKDLDIKLLNPDDLKSDEAKERWRPFCNQFDGLIEDFNYGTLLRLDCEKDYTEENTIFATRAQFFAVEIARNREGCNDAVFKSKCAKMSS
nr:PREDICTED: protein PBDC1 [Paralichthys olivaceus]